MSDSSFADAVGDATQTLAQLQATIASFHGRASRIGRVTSAAIGGHLPLLAEAIEGKRVTSEQRAAAMRVVEAAMVELSNFQKSFGELAADIDRVVSGVCAAWAAAPMRKVN